MYLLRSRNSVILAYVAEGDAVKVVIHPRQFGFGGIFAPLGFNVFPVGGGLAQVGDYSGMSVDISFIIKESAIAISSIKIHGHLLIVLRERWLGTHQTEGGAALKHLIHSVAVVLSVVVGHLKGKQIEIGGGIHHYRTEDVILNHCFGGLCGNSGQHRIAGFVHIYNGGGKPVVGAVTQIEIFFGRRHRTQACTYFYHIAAAHHYRILHHSRNAHRLSGGLHKNHPRIDITQVFKHHCVPAVLLKADVVVGIGRSTVG